jgi:predicted ArsR family transcriptional regulator
MIRTDYTSFPSGSAPLGLQDTSIAAYESLKSETKARRDQRILAYIQTNGGATCCEVETALGMLHQSASATITHLRKAGYIVDTGERRPTNTGRMAIVWQVIDAPE